MAVAVKACFDENDPLTTSEAARLYNVPKSTLIHRLLGRQSHRSSGQEQTKLSRVEEEAIISHIKYLIKAGFPPKVVILK